MNTLIEKYRLNKKGFIKDVLEEDLEQLLRTSSDKYYNTGEILLEDNEFDFLKDYLEENYPNNNFILQIGAPVKGDNKVVLDYWMGSMNKKKSSEEVEKWIVKYPGPDYCISDKLDGISFLLTIDNGLSKLYSRGDGNEGKDISFLLKYMNIGNVNLESMDKMVIRGEIVISKENFKLVNDKLVKEGGKSFSNPRSFVSGISNMKKMDIKKKKFLKYLDLVCFEIIEPVLECNKQFTTLKEFGFNVVSNQLRMDINYEILKDLLISRKDYGEYEVDGIIITQDGINERNKEKNPKYSFAFKMDLESCISTVNEIIWNQSKHGKLKPTVKFDKIELCGTNVEAATGNNANFIEKNKIGIGSVVKIIKSGEIIPKIVEVIKISDSGIGELPIDISYKWNATHKEIYVDNPDTNEIKIKRITCFFKNIGVEHIGPGIYKKLFEHGFQDIISILKILKEDLLKLPGIKEKSASNILENINKIVSIPINQEKVVAGSCIMGDGIGKRVVVKILDKFPDIFLKDEIPSKEDMNEIPSIQDKTSIKFLSKLKDMRLFMKKLEDNGIIFKKENKKKIEQVSEEVNNDSLNNCVDKPDSLDKINIVITGKRDKKLLEIISNNKINLQASVNSKTNYLVTDNLNGSSSKMKKAKELNIDIILIQDFIVKYD